MKLSDLCVYDKITIQCHDNPDADTIASGYGLYCYFTEKGKDVRLVYSGRNKIQKSNLTLMVDKLNLPVEYVSVDRGEVVEVDGLLITVDCQYGSGNVSGFSAENVAIIDHHQLDKEALPLSEVNSNLGSCATLVWKMLKEENFDVDSDERLGTALYYGLYTDTNQFSELYNPLDMDMREAVTVDKSLITLFRNSNLSLKELEIAGIAMIRYSFNDDYEFAVIKSKPCDPNILGLISDFLLQVDAIKTCVVFNEVNDGYKFSVRSCIKEVNAKELGVFLAEGIGTAGGHFEKAGGFISLKAYEDKYPTLHTEGYFNKRMVEYFDSFTILYSGEYKADTDAMQKYRKKKTPTAYVKVSEVFPAGTSAVVRTQEGDIELTVEEDVYLMFGVKGDVYLKRKAQFEKSYQKMDDRKASEFLRKAEYEPVIKNRESGQVLELKGFAHVCIPSEDVYIYASKLDHGVKVFGIADKNKYMLGNPGDYLAVSSVDEDDIYVIEKDLFDAGYEAL